jgi:hypothetical protein
MAGELAACLRTSEVALSQGWLGLDGMHGGSVAALVAACAEAQAEGGTSEGGRVLIHLSRRRDAGALERLAGREMPPQPVMPPGEDEYRTAPLTVRHVNTRPQDDRPKTTE